MIYLIIITLLNVISVSYNFYYAYKFKKQGNKEKRKQDFLKMYSDECKSMYDNLLKDGAVDVGMNRHPKFDFYYHDMVSLLRNISAEVVNNYDGTYADNRKQKL